MVASIKGHLDIAELLLENNNSNINVKDIELDTALHWAVILNNTKAVIFLIHHGIKLEEKNSNGNTPLMIACG